MTSYTFRLDESLKEQAFNVFRNYGLNPAQAIKMFLRQVAETNTIPVALDYDPQPNEVTIRAMQELMDGKGEVVGSIDELIEQIKHENRIQ